MLNLMRNRCAQTGLAIAVITLTAGSASAVPIFFTHEGAGSGTIGGVAFATTPFVITATGDTSNRAVQGAAFFIDHGSAQIDITGVGVFNFTTATRTFVNNGTQTVGFSRAGVGGADLFNGPTLAIYGAWDMLSSIGPDSGNGNLLQWGSSNVNTDGGVLLFNNGGSPATFTARVVPAPAATAFLGLGGIAALRRRRRRRSA